MRLYFRARPQPGVCRNINFRSVDSNDAICRRSATPETVVEGRVRGIVRVKSINATGSLVKSRGTSVYLWRIRRLENVRQ
jgi:hypothetical protein